MGGVWRTRPRNACSAPGRRLGKSGGGGSLCRRRPLLSPESVLAPSFNSKTYCLRACGKSGSNFVALPTANTSTPHALGSRVPQCPTGAPPDKCLTQLPKAAELGPTGLKALMKPNGGLDRVSGSHFCPDSLERARERGFERAGQRSAGSAKVAATVQALGHLHDVEAAAGAQAQAVGTVRRLLQERGDFAAIDGSQCTDNVFQIFVACAEFFQQRLADCRVADAVIGEHGTIERAPQDFLPAEGARQI